MTTQPTTPRAALLAFADYLAEVDMPVPLGWSVYAQLAREHAADLPDEPEPIDGELIGWSGLDVDQQLRVQALHAATRVWTGTSTITDDRDGGMLATARVFEAYLRGDQ